MSIGAQVKKRRVDVKFEPQDFSRCVSKDTTTRILGILLCERETAAEIGTMNIKEIIEEIKQLLTSAQTLQPRDVLQQVLNLAEAVAELERNAPGYDATDEIFAD